LLIFGSSPRYKILYALLSCIVKINRLLMNNALLSF